MKKLLVLLFALFFFSSCNEDEKIEKLKTETDSLKERLISLQKEEKALLNAPKFELHFDAVRKGEGLFQVLERLKVSPRERGAIQEAIQDSIELSNMREGQTIYVLRQESGNIEAFRYATNPATVHLLFKKDGKFIYKRIEKPVSRRESIFEGSLPPNSTLYGELVRVGIPKRMVGVVSGVLQCKVAFAQAQIGDKFKILLEEVFYEDSIWISGKVLYAAFEGKTVGFHEAFLYNDGDPKSTYNAHYTESGEALIFDGLRYPLERLHITSPYGTRIHPVTGERKTHNGIDYGSPSGTPIHAVANGKVTVSGYDAFSGNKVAIKHSDGSESYYLHMSARGVTSGTNVVAGQVIGRVGATGRVTGPHLHFAFKDEKGHWMNPQKKTMIATPKLQGERLLRLQKQAKEIRKELEKTASVKPRKMDDSNVLVRSREI